MFSWCTLARIFRHLFGVCDCVLLKKVKLNEFLTKIDFPMAEIFDVVYPKFCKFVNVILPMIDDDLRDFFSSSRKTPCCSNVLHIFTDEKRKDDILRIFRNRMKAGKVICY